MSLKNDGKNTIENEYFVFGSSADLEDWHKARARCFTASEIADLGLPSDGRPGYIYDRERRQLVSKKLEALIALKHGNFQIESPDSAFLAKLFAYGHEREPKIIDFLNNDSVSNNKWDRAEHNERLCLSKKYTNAGATPDGFILDNNGNALGTIEIKVSGLTASTFGSAKTGGLYIPPKYLKQIQYQLLITGFDRCVFVLEQYQKLSNGAGFIPAGKRYVKIVPRVPSMIEELKIVLDDLSRLLDQEIKRNNL